MAIQDPMADLLEKAKTGDWHALAALVEPHRLRLLHQIESRMGPGVRRMFDADDFLQETFAVAMKSIKRLSWEGDEAFYSWLGGIAEHVISNAARKKYWTKLEIHRDVHASGSSPSQHLRRDERFARLQDMRSSPSAPITARRCSFHESRA